MLATSSATAPVALMRDVSHTVQLGTTNLTILNNISLEIARGSWVALTGPSGSGKSTLLGILAGLDTPSHGHVRLNDVDITKMGEPQLARLRNQTIGVVFQAFNLIPTMTAQENVEAPLFVHRNRSEISQRAKAMLELVGLGDRRDHRPAQLSGGQQQRVAIARALVTTPQLLIADEPTGNLDSATSKQILELFADLRRQLNITIVMVTHDPDVAARADRQLYLVDGQIRHDSARAE
ncbi:ABC transporter ATP-binding protein [Herpetosiphon llansteffanensis]|uniref:ABC transporter ATP-binding protein n=1 Tax=Herpetosiphon llansteffanensis TaxID=2094568 RepID=UPI000D7C7544|nr:ABC transporter ATP-binding protein [Herpetosiphon llansteffanensis]